MQLNILYRLNNVDPNVLIDSSEVGARRRNSVSNRVEISSDQQIALSAERRSKTAIHELTPHSLNRQ